jgi:hypothetical protein
MRIAVFVIVISFLFFSCQDKKKVDFLIPEEKMVQVLVELHIADGVLNSTELPYSDSILRAENYYANILAKYNIDRPIFDSALKQYTENPQIYLKIYDKVIDTLRIQESKFASKINKSSKNISREK